MSTLATLAFIGAAGAAGTYLAMRPTVADGRVIAADLEASSKEATLSGVTCDREIPIGVRGAEFECTVKVKDGSTAKVRMSVNRAGQYQVVKILDSTPPSE
ncbi:MAG: DUF4333 domain-containing protein [Deltaproteobacteria bacterium]|nr:DUF4333 domain-containing protein [Deltaproteobacteria bacterium]